MEEDDAAASDDAQPEEARRARNDRDLALTSQLFSGYCAHNTYFKFIRGRTSGCKYGSTEGCREGSHARPPNLDEKRRAFEAQHSGCTRKLSSIEQGELIELYDQLGDPNEWNWYDWDPGSYSAEYNRKCNRYLALHRRALDRVAELRQRLKDLDEQIRFVVSGLAKQRLRERRSTILDEICDLGAAVPVGPLPQA